MRAEGLRRFARPYDWDAVDAVIRDEGGAVLEALFPVAEVRRLGGEVDEYLAQHEGAGLPVTGSSVYDKFLGHHTVRLHGLIEKFASASGWIGQPDLVAWGERALAPVATSVLLNAGELIQIGPGEPAQFLHRDTDSWPLVPLGEHPVLVNALVALDPFTLENGATRLAPGSWRWERDRRADPGQIQRAEMEPGDGLLFRGDLVHGGGANTSERPRRAISITYCAGWLRPVENSFLNISRERVRALPPRVRQLLGFSAYDGSRDRGGLVGLYENGDPAEWLDL